MEEHKRTMQNLLRKATHAGAVITDGQFRVIALASLPRDWDSDIRHLPGKMSSEAFIYLQGIWLQREKSVQTPERNRPMCTNPNCKKVGHTIQKCWARGGGAEGKGPNRWRFNRNNEPNWSQAAPRNAVAATVNTTAAAPSLETYVLLADMTRANTDTSSSMFTTALHQRASPTDRPPDSNDHSFLKGWEHQGLKEVYGVKDVHRHNVVASPIMCEVHRSNTLLYMPMGTPHVRTFIDSGATKHCWVNKSDFVEYRPVQGQSGTSALSGDVGKFTIEGAGTVEFTTRVGGTARRIRLTNVKHTPEFGHNLISLSTLDQ
ncbi:hypothetical protein EV368DRAFT_85495 [Lentinula lateritia]|nr:hypothetical protein EV368DRAFT_85495 [Lentinula lateritia]